MKITTRQMVMGGMLLALGILLPSTFHFTGLNGMIFSPMHIPVLLGGFILGPALGLVLGVITPALNMLINSMPQPPIVWVMMVELGVYGLAGGLFYGMLKNVKGKIIIALIMAMIVGRLAGGFTAYILSDLFGLSTNAGMFLKAAFVSAWPGIITHLILVPVLFKAYSLSSSNNINYKA